MSALRLKAAVTSMPAPRQLIAKSGKASPIELYGDRQPFGSFIGVIVQGGGKPSSSRLPRCQLRKERSRTECHNQQPIGRATVMVQPAIAATFQLLLSTIPAPIAARPKLTGTTPRPVAKAKRQVASGVNPAA